MTIGYQDNAKITQSEEDLGGSIPMSLQDIKEKEKEKKIAMQAAVT